MTDTPTHDTRDPLGLTRLGRIIDEATPDQSGIAGIAASYQAVMARYEALKDRYQLLKASNRQLAEEVAWLRDQCDDFALEQSEPDDVVYGDASEGNPSLPNRGQEDRW